MDKKIKSCPSVYHDPDSLQDFLEKLEKKSEKLDWEEKQLDNHNNEILDQDNIDFLPISKTKLWDQKSEIQKNQWSNRWREKSKWFVRISEQNFSAKRCRHSIWPGWIWGWLCSGDPKLYHTKASNDNNKVSKQVLDGVWKS